MFLFCTASYFTSDAGQDDESILITVPVHTLNHFLFFVAVFEVALYESYRHPGEVGLND